MTRYRSDLRQRKRDARTRELAEARQQRGLPPEGPMAECWACSEPRDVWLPCGACAAPSWQPREREGGVYVVRSESTGMVKIGVSAQLDTRFASFGPGFALLGVLWGADVRVERWLHQTFAALRDQAAAQVHGLPGQTEWFRPNPALERLAAGVVFMRDGRPWNEAT